MVNGGNIGGKRKERKSLFGKGYKAK